MYAGFLSARRRGIGAVVVFLWLAMAVCGRAEIIIVDDDGTADFNNIQAAIDDSNDGDIIYVFPGVYTGAGNYDIDYGGRAITVSSIMPEDPDIVDATIIDCNGLGRGVSLGTWWPENSVLDGLTITNGYTESRGGGIYVDYHWATITNCNITGNIAEGSGGGVYCEDGIISNCRISGNTASGDGGGVYCYQHVDIADCKISGNTASGYGGGVYGWVGVVTITDCIISENVAYGDGGGVYCYDRGGISDSKISGNVAQNGSGGGVCGNPYYWRYSPDISNCEVTDNRSGADGGGLAVCDNVTGCIISGNRAGDSGGGMYYDSVSEVANCTFSGNVARYCGGIAGDPSADTKLVLTNSILWGNISDPNDPNQIFCDVNDLAVSYSCIEEGDWIEGVGNIFDDPLFVRGPDDGGDGWGDDPCTPGVDEGANDDFGDLHLQAGSPCIDGGDPNFPWWLDEEDIDGQLRVMGGAMDMGADEFIVRSTTVVRPEGGEVWVGGSSHEILWSSYAVGAVHMLASINGGADWHLVANNLPGSGSLVWQLPMADSNQCLIKMIPKNGDPNVVVGESGVFTIHRDRPGPTVSSRWKSLGGDFDRAGLSENYGPELGCVKWYFETEGEIPSSVTIGARNNVHIACEDGKLYTLDTAGSLLWSFDANSPFLSAPSVGRDGTLYAGNENGRLYAIDAFGNMRWTHTADSVIYSSPAVSADGNTVYACSADGVVYALRADGSELWQFETDGYGTVGGSILASPAIGADGTVYVTGYADANVYALDPNDGSLIWDCNFIFDGLGFASPVVGEDGTIYQVLTYDPCLHAIDPNTGDIIWSLILDESYMPVWDDWYDGPFYAPVMALSEPVVGPDGTIYVNFDDPDLYAVDPNGSLKWVTELGMISSFTLTVGSDGLIYAAGSDGYLSVIDANGVELSRFRGNSWLTFPVLAADGAVIVCDANGVWAIGGGCEGRLFDLHRPLDLNGSGRVDFPDFAVLAADWLECTDIDCDYEGDEIYLGGDVNRDLHVDFDDLRELVSRWLEEY